MAPATVEIKKAMISSTILDLPDHRKAVRDVCLQQSVFPLMMEHLPSSDAEAIQVSLGLVDQADLYVGIFAFRYGHVPQGHSNSITEKEYNRAVARGMPRLIFIMHDDHPVRARDVDQDEKAKKLSLLKERLRRERVVSSFHSPEELCVQLMASLSRYRQSLPPPPPPPPEGATALCRDGTYSKSKSRSGACSYHGGVKEWLV
jgi:hypothetical protein